VPICVLRTTGLSALESLSLVGCGVTLSLLDPGLDRLRQLAELELCGGTVTVCSPTRTTGKP